MATEGPGDLASVTGTASHVAATVGRPATTTPDRRARSIRRTTTVDSTRPEGLDGPITLVATGRDVMTGPDGKAHVRDQARTEMVATPSMQGRIVRIAANPPDLRLETLVGSNPYSGFRQAVDTVFADRHTEMSVHRQLLNDVPIALMLSGRVLRAAGKGLGEALLGRPSNVDICAGWADGGTAVVGYSKTGPPLLTGPVAPEVDRASDPFAWHVHDDLPRHSTRRRRRLDVWDDDGVGQVDCFFRDSHVNGDGVETVVHEYTLCATFDPGTASFVAMDVDFGALPFPECPAAMESVGRLHGVPVHGLGRWVRATMKGVATCTHLNDQLCSLEVVPALYAALPEPPRRFPSNQDTHPN